MFKTVFASLFPLKAKDTIIPYNPNSPNLITGDGNVNYQERPPFRIPENAYTPVKTDEVPEAKTLPQASDIDAQTANPNILSQLDFSNVKNNPQLNAASIQNNSEMPPTSAPLQTVQQEQPERPNILSQLDFSNVRARTPLEDAEYNYDEAVDRTNNPVNKDHGLKGKIFEAAQNFLYGLGESYRMNPNADWRVGLASGAAGVGGGLIDNKWNERRNAQADVAKYGAQYKTLADREKAKAETEKLRIDTQNAVLSGKEKIADIVGKLSDNQKKTLVNDPQWQIIEKTKVFTPEQAKYFNEKLGTNLSPASWQTFVEAEQNGTKFIRPEYSPNYKPNTTISADPTKKPVGVTVTTGEGDNKESKTFPVLPKDALEYDYKNRKDVAEAEAEERKAARAEVVKSTELNFKSKADWKEQTTKARAKYEAAQNSLKILDAQINELKTEIQRKRENRWDSSVEQTALTNLENARTKTQSESDENQIIMNAKEPDSFSLPPRPNNNKNPKRGSYSVDQIQNIINGGKR